MWIANVPLVVSAHIFFDDAMSDHHPDEHDYETNDFVRLLVSVVDESAR